MIESRELTKEELQDIIANAQIEETRNLTRFLYARQQSAFDFFTDNSIYSFGLISDGRPIYFAYIIPNKNGVNELWTVVNSNVKEQFSLYKHSKKSLLCAISLHGKIYATMEKVNDRNIRWVEALGFARIFDDGKIVKFMIE